MRLHGDFQWRSKIPERCHPAWRRSLQHVNLGASVLAVLFSSRHLNNTASQALLNQHHASLLTISRRFLANIAIRQLVGGATTHRRHGNF